MDLSYKTDWRKVVKLDCLDRPGLKEVEFLDLFVQCDVCKLITTRQVFEYHYCVRIGRDGLELTDEEDGSECLEADEQKDDANLELVHEK